MKGQRFRKEDQKVNTAIAVSPETLAHLKKVAQPGEVIDDTLRRLLGLPSRDPATVRRGPPDDTQ
jgi:hypothetical protein